MSLFACYAIVCVNVCAVCMYVFESEACINVCVCVRVCVPECGHMFVCVCACLHVYIYVCVPSKGP